uniref:Uncharacterized protein n=1 Tax=Zea mays TaxID=4577 RepID=A0A804RJ26_MAIZE
MVSSSPSLGGSKATDGDVSNFTAFLQASPKSFVVVEFFTHWCNGHQPRRSWSTHAMQPNWMKLGLGAFFVGLTEHTEFMHLRIGMKAPSAVLEDGTTVVVKRLKEVVA